MQENEFKIHLLLKTLSMDTLSLSPAPLSGQSNFLVLPEIFLYLLLQVAPDGLLHLSGLVG